MNAAATATTANPITLYVGRTGDRAVKLDMDVLVDLAAKVAATGPQDSIDVLGALDVLGVDDPVSTMNYLVDVSLLHFHPRTNAMTFRAAA